MGAARRRRERAAGPDKRPQIENLESLVHDGLPVTEKSTDHWPKHCVTGRAGENGQVWPAPGPGSPGRKHRRGHARIHSTAREARAS